MSSAAVITGMGAVGPHGIGRERLAAALLAGRPLASAVDRSALYHRADGSRLAALVPQLDLSRWLPAAQARRLGMPSRWAIAASRIALDEAGLSALAGRRTAVVLATAFGAPRFTEKLVRQILEEGPEAAQPFYFSECVANAAAGQVAIALGARGANVTITQREAGPLLALARGAQEVRERRADVVLVGSADEMTSLLHALLDRFGATARARDGREELARPFDLRRDGILAGEGATALVIEREEDVAERGARPIARIVASSSAFDATATASDWGTGWSPLASALAAALARAGRRPGDVDRIVSGAQGSRRGDRLEGLVIRAVWSTATVPPILVPKAVLGEHGGAILAAGVLAVGGAAFGRPVAFEAPDPEVTIRPHDGSPLDAPECVLISSLASGGAAAWVLLERA